MQKAKDETRQREVAARLRALRLELNYEQFEIAELVGVSPQCWSYYENAKRQFDFDVAVVLCEQVRKLNGRRGKRAVTMDYIYRGAQKADMPLGFYKKLQRGVREVEADRAAASRAVDRILAEPRKKPTRAKRVKVADK
jgi:DNA-binding XRE family transcriptional regulator